jgi:hypothetical protein
VFKQHLGFRIDSHLCCADPEKDSHAQVLDNGAAIVFYCDHCHSSSPSVAEQHIAWFRSRRPDSRQQVKLLHRCMAGLLRRANDLGRVVEFFAIFWLGRNWGA